MKMGDIEISASSRKITRHLLVSFGKNGRMPKITKERLNLYIRHCIQHGIEFEIITMPMSAEKICDITFIDQTEDINEETLEDMISTLK